MHAFGKSAVTVLVVSGCLYGGSGESASLLDAVRAGDLSGVQNALKQHTNPNQTEMDGTTALERGVQENRPDIVQTLLAAGADVNAKNHFGVTPLAVALMNGNAEMTQKLLKAGASVKISVPELGTPLLAAARSGNPEVIRGILGAGASVNEAEPASGQTALMLAATEGHKEAVQVLLSAGADFKVHPPKGETALFYAVRGGHKEVTETLLAAGADVNERVSPDAGNRRGNAGGGNNGAMPAKAAGDSMLVVAILNGHFGLADYLLSKGADPNSVSANWMPLHSLSRARNYEEMQYPPIPIAPGEMDSLELAKHLLARGADPNARGTTTVARRQGGDQNYKDLVGATPFFLAAKSGDVAYMKLLLAAGADPKIPIDDHTTPLMVAAGIGCVPGQWVESERDVLSAVKLMIEELNLDVNAVNDANETAVHGAVCRGADSVIQYLVDKGAKLNVKDADEQTPLDQVEHGLNRAVSINGPKIIIFHSPDHTVALVRKLTEEQRAAGWQPRAADR